jgi:phosphoribosylformimino-5-aminoimidazole carboxamide ribotide isomerase
MAGPNFTSLAEIQKASPFPVICSGGVTTLEDVKQLIAANTAGAIIGRSLYEGHMDLVEVLRLSKASLGYPALLDGLNDPD